MGFLDTISKKASEAYDATTKKTGDIAKEAKLRMKINENKSNINEVYQEIGKKVYEKHVRKEGIDIERELEEECTKIDVLSDEIETCLASILELKSKKQCPKCFAEIDANATFCPKCGEKQTDVVTDDAENSNDSNLEEVTEIMAQTTQEEAKEKLQNEININEQNNL